MDGYLGEVKMFAGNYPPANWMYCQGQILPVQQYAALFSIMGNVYGGDGINNFGLPDLRGRVPLGSGIGIGLSNRIPGMASGYERVTLQQEQMPEHSHEVLCDTTSGDRDLSADPKDKYPAKLTQGKGYGTNMTGSPKMDANMISPKGDGLPHENMQPWLCINYIICVIGNYPPRS